MPTAKKLPSGSYRCQVFAGYEIVDGKKKRKYESFTAPTKREAEAMAAKWNQDRKQRPEDITVKDAIDNYIKSRENVLSPSTIRGYKASLNRFDPINHKKLRDLKNVDVQMWVSGMSKDLKPKTVKNTYGLLTATLQLYAPGITLNVKLPAKEKKAYYIPSDEDVKKVLSVARPELWCAVMLARYYSLRRGEICALNASDLNGNVLTIQRAMVHDDSNEWVIRERPKTDDSYRYLIISDPLLNVLQSMNGRIINCNPDALCNRFNRAVKVAKVKPFNFHILRHMFASSAAMIGIPDFYTAKMGGWNSNSRVLKEIYQNVRDDDFREQMDLVNKAMQHDMQHDRVQDKKKAAN